MVAAIRSDAGASRRLLVAALEEFEFITNNGGGVGLRFREARRELPRELIYPPNSPGAADQELSGQRRAA
jgi:hypothetical protein